MPKIEKIIAVNDVYNMISKFDKFDMRFGFVWAILEKSTTKKIAIENIMKTLIFVALCI